MRNGLRRWQQIGEKKSKPNVIDLQFNEVFSVLTFKGLSRIQAFGLFSALLTLLSSYFNFMGYSLLKTKLHVLGFDYVVVDSISFNNIYQGVLGVSPVINELFSLEQHGKALKAILFYVAIIAAIPWVTILVWWLYGVVKFGVRKLLNSNGLIKVKHFRPSYEVVLAAKTSVFIPVFSLYYLVAIFILVLFIVGCSYLFSVFGIYLGKKQANDYIEKPICVSAENKKESYVYCRVIVASMDEFDSVKNEKYTSWARLRGQLIYENIDYRYFVTNSSVYTLNKSNKVIMNAPLCHYDEDTKSCKKDELKNNDN